MEIRISKTGRTCCVCDRTFEHDEEVHSLVRATEGSLEREDYCDACWAADRASGAYSLWTLSFYDPKVADQEPPEVFSPLRRLFYEAVEQEDRVDQAKAFLAAQLLRRQKVFRLIKESDEEEGEARLYLYADRIGNRLIEVRDPRFSYPEMEAGRRRLIARLEELESPEPAGDDGNAEVDGHGHDAATE
ncbi:MAG TPA: hypothetical protein PKI11_14165 [Candidatus Hydrogenedentes bacterium]|nr:hypothetical protein [Candidatus Hydrogenedentota bacterium]